MGAKGPQTTECPLGGGKTGLIIRPTEMLAVSRFSIAG